MVSSITERQKELLENLYRYIISTGYPPTFEELREQLNVSSNQSVIDLLAKLEKKEKKNKEKELEEQTQEAKAPDLKDLSKS